MRLETWGDTGCPWHFRGLTPEEADQRYDEIRGQPGVTVFPLSPETEEDLDYLEAKRWGWPDGHPGTIRHERETRNV